MDAEKGGKFTRISRIRRIVVERMAPKTVNVGNNKQVHVPNYRIFVPFDFRRFTNHRKIIGNRPFYSAPRQLTSDASIF